MIGEKYYTSFNRYFMVISGKCYNFPNKFSKNRKTKFTLPISKSEGESFITIGVRNYYYIQKISNNKNLNKQKLIIIK